MYALLIYPLPAITCFLIYHIFRALILLVAGTKRLYLLTVQSCPLYFRKSMLKMHSVCTSLTTCQNCWKRRNLITSRSVVQCCTFISSLVWNARYGTALSLYNSLDHWVFIHAGHLETSVRGCARKLRIKPHSSGNIWRQINKFRS